MPYDPWPLVDLRLRVATTELRPMTEADLPALTAALPPDVDLDPTLPRFGLPTSEAQRAATLYQQYWRSLGTWRPEAWVLPFVVHERDEPGAPATLVGWQTLEGTDFLAERTVDTASWMIPDARGRGIGTRARRAVLALAFGPMAAGIAISSAFHDNAASLGVSRSLGYAPAGESQLARRDGRLDTLCHVRLAAAEWAARHLGDDVSIDGFERCRPLFGLT